MLKQRVFVSFLSVFVIAVTGLVAVPFLTRLLPSEELGRFFVYLGIVSFLQVIDGIRPVVVYHINNEFYSENACRLAFRWVNKRFIFFVTPFLALSFFLFANFSFASVLYIVFLYVSYLLMSLEWGLLEAKNDISFTALARAFGWVVAYCGFVFVAYSGVDVSFCLLIVSGKYFVLWILFCQRNKKFYSCLVQEKFDVGLKRKMLFDAIENIKIQIGAVVMSASDKLIAPFLIGYSNFSHYSIQAELASKAYIVNSSVRRAVQPSYSKGDSRRLADLPFHAVCFFSIGLIVVFIAVVLAEPGLRLYAGLKYAEFFYLFPVFLMIFPANVLGSAGTIVLHAKGDFKLHGKINAWCAVVFVPGFFGAVSMFGLIGACAFMALSRYVDLVVFFVALKKYALVGRWFSLFYSLSVVCFFAIVFLLLNKYYWFALLVASASICFGFLSCAFRKVGKNAGV